MSYVHQPLLQISPSRISQQFFKSAHFFNQLATFGGWLTNAGLSLIKISLTFFIPLFLKNHLIKLSHKHNTFLSSQITQLLFIIYHLCRSRLYLAKTVKPIKDIRITATITAQMRLSTTISQAQTLISVLFWQILNPKIGIFLSCFIIMVHAHVRPKLFTHLSLG